MNAFVSFLEKAGKDILAIFKGAEAIATDVAPIIDVAFPAIAGIYNMTVSAVGNAEALGEVAATQGSTNAQKLANVLSAITPTATQTLAGFGINVDKTHLTAYVNAVVASLNALPAPAAAAAPVAAAPAAAPVVTVPTPAAA